MTPTDLKTLLAAATLGPWQAPLLWDESGLTKNKVSHAPPPGGTWKRDTPDICVFPPALLNRGNARLIPVARNLLPAFLRLWEAIEGGMAAMEAEDTAGCDRYEQDVRNALRELREAKGTS